MKDIIQDAAEKVLSGKDEWIFLDMDGLTVATTTIFLGKYVAVMKSWVEDFVAKSVKVHNYGLSLVNPEDMWERKVGDEAICQFKQKSPKDETIIVIETRERLVKFGIIKLCVPEGQNRSNNG